MTSCGAFETGGPDWLFGLMLGAGGLALVYGLVCGSLLQMQGRPPRPPTSRWSYALAIAGMVLSTPSFAVAGWPWAAVLLLATAIAAAPPILVIAAMGRRAAMTGVFPPARSAPLGMYWVLVAVAGLGLATSIAALAAQILLGHSTPC